MVFPQPYSNLDKYTNADPPYSPINAAQLYQLLELRWLVLHTDRIVWLIPITCLREAYYPATLTRQLLASKPTIYSIYPLQVYTVLVVCLILTGLPRYMGPVYCPEGFPLHHKQRKPVLRWAQFLPVQLLVVLHAGSYSALRSAGAPLLSWVPFLEEWLQKTPGLGVLCGAFLCTVRLTRAPRY